MTPHSAEPLVSVLVRSMDRPSLFRALDSVANQTWPHLEIVVAAACGSSHQRLPEDYRGRPLRLVFDNDRRRLPRPQAANLCLDRARGEWLNFLDDDDEFLPEHLETLMRARAPGTRVIYSKTRVLDENGAFLGHCGFAGFHAQFYYQSRSTPAGTLFHRSLVEEGARFDPDFDVLEDHDFFVNLASRSQFQFVDAATGIWHSHSGSSGAGFGSNHDPERLEPFYARLRSKWAAVFERWLAQTEALLFLGQHMLRLGNPTAALPYLEQAIRRRPDDINALNLCGLANLHTGNFDRAEALIMRAVAKLPAHAALADNLALVRARRAQAADRLSNSKELP